MPSKSLLALNVVSRLNTG